MKIIVHLKETDSVEKVIEILAIAEENGDQISYEDGVLVVRTKVCVME